jgi:hypothetical protein
MSQIKSKVELLSYKKDKIHILKSYLNLNPYLLIDKVKYAFSGTKTMSFGIKLQIKPTSFVYVWLNQIENGDAIVQSKLLFENRLTYWRRS